MEYKGDLKEFPQEVVEKMLERQVEQGNKRDVTIFEQCKSISWRNGGFSWSTTKEGDDWWGKVIGNRNFDFFFERYPKQPIPEKWFVRVPDVPGDIESLKQWKVNKRPDLDVMDEVKVVDYEGLGWYDLEAAEIEEMEEIEFESFKKYILKMEKEEIKKIIGYKWKDEGTKNLYQKASLEISAGSNYLKYGNYFENGINKEYFPQGGGTKRDMEKAGVLDIWFIPVYEEEKLKLPNLDGYEGSYIDGVIKYGCQTMKEDDLFKLGEVLKENTSIEYLRISGKNVYRRFILDLIEVVEKLKK